MSFSCASCGYRNAEVKGGGAVPLKGCRATLRCVDEGDLLRDVLKSDTAAVTIPELDLELVHGTLGSVLCGNQPVRRVRWLRRAVRNRHRTPSSRRRAVKC